MNTNDKPAAPTERTQCAPGQGNTKCDPKSDETLQGIVLPILDGLRDQDLNIRICEDKAVTAGTLNGRAVSFRIERLTADSTGGMHAVHSEPGGTGEDRSTQGTLFLTFSYLRENDLQAAINPDLSIGNRYHPARLAKRIGSPVPTIFDLTALALQANYFRVVTDEDRLPAEVTDCRLLFARGNWHPQVANLTQGLVADLKWVPAA